MIALLKKYRLIAGAVVTVTLLGAVFTAGWQFNGWRLKAKMAERETEIAAAYEQRRAELLSEYGRQARADEEAIATLVRRLAANRQATNQLEEELRNIQLTPDDPIVERVIVPGDCENDQPEIVIANPFTPDFVRLWNQSANRDFRSSSTGEKETR